MSAIGNIYEQQMQSSIKKWKNDNPSEILTDETERAIRAKASIALIQKNDQAKKTVKKHDLKVMYEVYREQLYDTVFSRRFSDSSIAPWLRHGRFVREYMMVGMDEYSRTHIQKMGSVARTIIPGLLHYPIKMAGLDIDNPERERMLTPDDIIFNGAISELIDLKVFFSEKRFPGNEKKYFENWMKLLGVSSKEAVVREFIKAIIPSAFDTGTSRMAHDELIKKLNPQEAESMAEDKSSSHSFTRRPLIIFEATQKLGHKEVDGEVVATNTLVFADLSDTHLEYLKTMMGNRLEITEVTS